jgi:hypothetical protein
MTDGRLPGLLPRRLARLMEAAIGRCHLDLSGTIVLTEAATGAYVVTPVLAAMAGARRVFGVTYPSRHGSVDDVASQTMELAKCAGVQAQIEIITDKTPEVVSLADIVTNSGHLRPLDSKTIDWMKPSAALPLMYEAWEFRHKDVDLDACVRKGICVAGTNERHPAIDVFSFLGIMAVRLLLDASISVVGSRILLVCDNVFVSYLQDGLARAGAQVDIVSDVRDPVPTETYDVIVVALRLKLEPSLARSDADVLAARFPDTLIAQFWGDLERSVFLQAGVPVWPPAAPAAGHMGILPSEVGPEPVIRLQTGGLKVGEVLWRARLADLSPVESVSAVERSGFGQRVRRDLAI